MRAVPSTTAVSVQACFLERKSIVGMWSQQRETREGKYGSRMIPQLYCSSPYVPGWGIDRFDRQQAVRDFKERSRPVVT